MSADDLDQQFSHLPQPYRMICKIIELEIIDSAWLIITRNHPELMVGSDGKPISIRRNHMLHNVYTPKGPPISPFRHWVSMAEIAKILFGTTISGELNAVDSFSSILLSSVSTLPSIPDIEYFSPSWIVNVVQHPESMVITVCVGVIYLVTEENTEAPAAGKKGGKKGAPVTEAKPEKKKKCQLTIASMAMGTASVVSPGSLEIVDTIIIDLESAEDDRSISVDIFPAEDILAVTSTKGGCTIYPLPHIAAQTEAVTEQTTEKGEVLKSLCSMLVADFFEGRLLQSVTFTASTDEYLPSIVKRAQANMQPPQNESSQLSLTQSHATSIPAASDASHPKVESKPKQLLPISQIMSILGISSKEMVAIFQDAREWQLIDLHKLHKPKKAAPPPVAAPAKGAPKPKKGEEAPVLEGPPANPNALHATVIGRWQLPSAVTQFKLDERRITLLLGLADGSVSLWDLRSRTLISVLCQHMAPVSSLCFCSNPPSSKSPRHIISGSLDGIICFHTVASKADSSSKANEFRPSYENPQYTANGLTFRNDVRSEVVKIISCPLVNNFKYPICVVYYSDETVAIYDYETALLLGQVKYCIQRSLNDPTWHPATLPDICQVGTVSEDQFDKLNISGSIVEEGDEENEADNDNQAAANTETTKSRIAGFDAQYKQNKSIVLDTEVKEADEVDQKAVTKRQFPYLLTFSPRGISAVYVKNDRVINDFVDIKMEDIILQSYPCLQAICTEEKKDNLSKYFIQLTKEERVQPSLPRGRVSEILGLVEDRFPSKPGGKAKRGNAPFTRNLNSNSSISAGGSNAIKVPKSAGLSSGSKLLDNQSATSSVSVLHVKPWALEGKDITDEELPLSARSNDSSLSAGKGKGPALLEIDTAEFGDYAFQFDPIHAARRAVALNKHNKLLANIGVHGSATSTSKVLGSKTGGAAGHSSASIVSASSHAGPSTSATTAPKSGTLTATARGKAKDPVLVLLNGLADRFK